ncbi:MAG: glycosyltransferase family 2 protein [Pollutimonas bauzanensis]
MPERALVVVPTYKRPDLLERCLAALLRQTLAPDDWEILVCDDGPSPQARAVAQAMSARAGGRPAIRYLPVSRTQGPAGARNVGWRAAGAPVIAFTDDDTLPEPGWLQEGLEAMASGAEAAVGTIVMPLPPRPSDLDRDAARLEQAEFATANCFVRRDILEAVGGFDERYTLAWREDSDLHFALIERGCRVAPAPAATVVHPLRAARFAAGIGMQKKVMFDVLLYRKFPRLYRQRIRSGPPWFYLSVCAALLLALAALLGGWQRLAMAALLLWGLLSLFFFLRRLRLSAFTLRNVAELLLTSVLIPPLSVFWRAVGAARFGGGLP